jgi:hypothetical protein
MTFNVTSIQGDDDDATITVEQVAIPVQNETHSEDVATLAATWLWSAFERFWEKQYEYAGKPEGVLEEVFRVMRTMLPDDPEYAHFCAAYVRVMGVTGDE